MALSTWTGRDLAREVVNGGIADAILYARTWQGEPLGADDYVISCDEKTSIQARCRCHRAGPALCGSNTTTTAAARRPT